MSDWTWTLSHEWGLRIAAALAALFIVVHVAPFLFKDKDDDE